jgi:hypothetical protein
LEQTYLYREQLREGIMPLPPDIDQLIRTRFEKLVTEAEEVFQKAQEDARQSMPGGIPSGLMREKVVLSGSSFDALKTKFLSVLHLLAGGSKSVSMLIMDVHALMNTPSGVDSIVGKIKGLKDDYESGMLINLVEVIEANVVSDYLGQAEGLLKEGQPGKFDHVPAAVLLGAILEDGLRRLCQRQTPPVDIVKPNGEPKMLNLLIDDLKKANVFNELNAKQLRVWAEIRNKAAHGEFEQFTRPDVEQMLTWVQRFLADYL